MKPLRNRCCAAVIPLITAAFAFPAFAGICDNPPVALDDQVATRLAVTVVDVLANDDDVDGEALEVSLLGGSCSALGSLAVDGALVTYVADPGPVVPCSFSYRVTDESGLWDEALVEVLFENGIFSDGFEAGNTASWSATICPACP